MQPAMMEPGNLNTERRRVRLTEIWQHFTDDSSKKFLTTERMSEELVSQTNVTFSFILQERERPKTMKQPQ
jgi:hypothetical protein